jgi:hypothetical protein
MPREGSLILSDVRGPTLAIVCEACRRHGVGGVVKRLDRKRARRRYARSMSFWAVVKTVPGHVR